MICPNCGKESSESNKKCKFCGYEFTEEDLEALNTGESSISEQIPSESAQNGEAAEKEESKQEAEKNVEAKAEFSIPEEIPAEKSEINIFSESSISEQVPFESALNAEYPDDTEKGIDEDNKYGDKFENSISEEIPSEETEVNIFSESSISEQVPFESTLNAEYPDDTEKGIDEDNKYGDKFENSISEEIPAEKSETNIFSESSISEQVPFESTLNAEYPDDTEKGIDEDNKYGDKFENSISEEIPAEKSETNIFSESSISEEIPESQVKEIENAAEKDIPDGPVKKKHHSTLLFIIALALVGCLLIYYGSQSGSNASIASSATPLATEEQTSSMADDYTATVVETQIEGKTYYSLLVSGKKAATVTVNDKDNYDLEGKSVSIPINVSDYTQDNPNQQEVTATIKVKIVSSDNKETNIDVPYTFNVQSTATPAVS